jgi:hypothetical protein
VIFLMNDVVLHPDRAWRTRRYVGSTAQDVHSDRQKRRRIRPETTIKRLKSCRKRPPFLTVFHRFRAVIHRSRLRNGLHRTGKRRRFMPFPSNNGVSYWHRIFAVYCLKTAVFIRLRLCLPALKSSEI